MDTFIEKIVTKKKDAVDYLIIGAIIIVVAIATLAILAFLKTSLNLLIVAGVVYGGYHLISSRNVEFEYIVTNGDLDIDKIISRKRRKRIFSGSCKEFEVMAKVKSRSYSPQVQSIKNKIMAVSSLDEEDVYFATTNYKNERTVIFFQPNEKMLANFKIYIPRKIEG